MPSAFKMPEKESHLILILAAVYLLTRLPLMFIMPLMQDEAIYAVMIEEQKLHPTILPTFLGYLVSWKPPLFFWTDAAFPPLSHLELSYRFLPFLCGLLTLPLLYFLLRNTGASRNISFFTVLIFLLSLPSLYPNSMALTDSLFFFLTVSALYLYTERRFGDRRFLAAAVFAFLAFFTKQLVPLMIPLLALAYFYNKERKTLRNPMFLVSLVAVPLVFLVHLYILNSAGLVQELYLAELQTHVGGLGFFSPLEMFLGSMQAFVAGAGVWFALSLFGVWKYWRQEPFMAVWYMLSLFAMLSGYYMVWYYLPVMPAIAFFAALTLVKWEGREQIDAFFAFFFCLTIILTLAGLFYVYSALYSGYMPQKEAGLILAGKENVLIVGAYQPGIVSYKAVTEARAGRQPDFGWVILTSAQSNEKAATDFIKDYHTDAYQISNGSFSGMFSDTSVIYRKDSNLTSFDYVAVVGRDVSLPGAEVLYNKSSIVIYKISSDGGAG